MPPDCYQVEVLHYLNPHLIWIEVIDQSLVKGDNFVFEQIGLYGILPLELTLDVEAENLKTRLSNKWLPAASAIIEKALAETKEVWFCPTYIDRRSSIFDDNIHKYGELLLKRHNEKLKPLTKILIKAGFASYNLCLFHQELGLGNIKIRLQNFESQAVIKAIEKYYEKKSVSKKDWQKSVRTQTVVTNATQELESALTEMNLMKHNNVMLQLLENKKKDLESCKDVEEDPVGRAYKLKHKRVPQETKTKESLSLKQRETNHMSTLLKKKLELITSKHSCRKLDQSKSDTKQILENTKKFLELNASKNEEGVSFPKPDTFIKNNYKEKYKKLNNNCIGETYNFGDKNNSGLKLSNATIKECPPTSKQKKIGYGPPGFPKTRLSLQVISQNGHEHPILYDKNEENIKENGNLDAKAGSGMNVEINKKHFLTNIQQDTKINDNYVRTRINSTDSGENTSIKGNNRLSSDMDNDSSTEIVVKSSSKVLQKRLMLHGEKITRILNSSITSYSDTTNKDSSSSLEEVKIKPKEKRKQYQDSDNEDSEEIMKIINDEYSPLCASSELKCHNSLTNNYKNTMKNSVNPFKNVDPNISLFIDKVVTPVLMVHTKMDNRIEPVFNIRDINFNTNIQVALKNMLVERPMMLQTISWFCILRGYSTFMISPNGSGKTMGYLPAVCRLVSDFDPDETESVGPTCIIVCATAKSVTEVEKMAKMFLGDGKKVLTCFAGVDETFVTTSLLNGCNLLISTPSFLTRLLQVSDFGIDLRRLATIVFDDCERLEEVYINELKFILFKIKESLKNRTNKELKVQYILVSRNWCEFMEPIAKKAPYSVICISAFQECVLYSKAEMSVNFVQQDNKVNAVLDFLTQIETTKRTVIVCGTDEEVIILKKALEKYKHAVFACDNSMTINDLYNLRGAWDEYEDPLLGPILLCCDDTLTHMNVTDAHSLVIYSLPPLFSTFCRWFSTLNENYLSIFKPKDKMVKIKILIEDSNLEQLPKMLKFIKRCTDNIPQYLNDISDKVIIEKDKVKASNLIPLCDNLLGLGSCPDYWNCNSRHTIVEDFDDLKKWVPTIGQITFKILHYHSAALFSVRLLSNTVKGLVHKYPQTYSTLSLKMGMYYGTESNRRPIGIPKIGDICAVSIKQNFFVRCQVIKILSKCSRGNPLCVLIKLIDEEKLETTRNIYLYYLPEEMQNIETHVIQVRLANIQPKDKDITFSDLARDQLKMITEKDDDLYMRGDIAMAIGNCVFVNTLEACQDLASLSQTVVKHDFKRYLLEKHAVPNMVHMEKVKELVKGIYHVEVETETSQPIEPRKTITSGSWSYLDSGVTSLVVFGSVISPHKFFVRLQKFDSCLNLLLKEIQKYVAENRKPLNEVNEGDIVIALFPDDTTFQRARIDAVIDESKVKCFFVDKGDWREVSTKNLVAIKEEFVTKMPFQAIECRLIGVEPAGEEWTDFSINWFCDKCFHDETGSVKNVCVKYFTKEKAEFTGGNKYDVVMIDTNGDKDVLINQLLVDVNVARRNISEMKCLAEIRSNNRIENKSKDDVVVPQKDDIKECVAMCVNNNDIESIKTSTLCTLFKQPIRSVPLVASDYDESDDSERWNINMTSDFLKIFKPATKDAEKIEIQNEHPIIQYKTESYASKGTICMPIPLKRRSESTDLDSDDFTSTESLEALNNPKERVIKSLSVTEQMRKPKLTWRQSKNVVIIKINLISLQMYDIKIEGRSVSFAATLNGVDYAFDVELYGAIDVMKSFHSNKEQYIVIKLHKILNRNWLTLTKDGENRKWIVYDMDAIDASDSDEETIEEHNKCTMLNAIKNNYNNEESASEDEDFMDDVN